MSSVLVVTRDPSTETLALRALSTAGHEVISARASDAAIRSLLNVNVDAVILSVQREISRSPLVYAAMQRLTSLGINVLGAVVGGMDPEEVYANSVPTVAA